MARRGALVGCLVAAVLLTADARADAPGPARAVADMIELEPTECLSREALAAKTASFLHRDSISPHLSMNVTMRGPDAFFQLSRSGRIIGERLVPRRDLTCEGFLSVLALALAVAVDSALQAEESAAGGTAEDAKQDDAAAEDAKEQRSRDERPSASAPAPEAPTKRPPPSPAKPAERPSVALTFEPAALSALHEPTIGAALGLVVAHDGVGRIGLSSFVTAPVSTDLGGDRARVGIVTGRLDGCLAPPLRTVPIAPCVGAIVGVHRAEGVALSAPATSVTDSALWAALAIGPELTLAFGRWSLVARVEPWWVLRPSRLVAARAGNELSRTGPAFGLAGFVGVRWTIF